MNCPQGCRQHVVFAPEEKKLFVIVALRSVFTTFPFKNLLSLHILSKVKVLRAAVSISEV